MQEAEGLKGQERVATAPVGRPPLAPLFAWSMFDTGANPECPPRHASVHVHLEGEVGEAGQQHVEQGLWAGFVQAAAFVQGLEVGVLQAAGEGGDGSSIL